MQARASTLSNNSVSLVHPATVSSLRQNREARAHLRDQVALSGSQGRLLVKVGQALASILMGKRSPSLYSPMLVKTYRDIPWDNIKPLFLQYLIALSKNHSNLKVMEVGSRNRNTAEHVLEALDSSVSHYHFTDYDDSLFDDVQPKLGKWSDKVHYGVLNLGSDVTSDGFSETTAYDIVVAAHISRVIPFEPMEVTNHMKRDSRHSIPKRQWSACVVSSSHKLII